MQSYSVSRLRSAAGIHGVMCHGLKITQLYIKNKKNKKIILIILMFKTYMKVPRYRLYLQEGSFYVIYIL